MNDEWNEVEKGDAGIAADLAAEVICALRKLSGGALAKDANSAVFKAIGKLREIEAALRRIEETQGDSFFAPAASRAMAPEIRSRRADGCVRISSSDSRTMH